MTRIFLYILLLAFLAGMFDACMDARRDYADAAIFARIDVAWFHSWYVGGNDRYSLPVWGPTDFWHASKSCLFLSWTAIVGLGILIGKRAAPNLRWFQLLGICVLVYLMEGWSFILFYHFIWRL